jgi:NADH-quinone oxidoreductase subunit E
MAVALDDTIDLSLMEEIFEEYKGREEGALIPILQKTQGIYGWLPPQSLDLIAQRLNLSTSKVYGVATFYAQFYLEKRGKHVLKLCDGTACHVKGTPILATAVEEEYHIHVGETTEDGELTVEIVYCIGSCALAPVAILDDEVMGRVKQDKLLRTLKRKLSPAAKKESGS